MNQPVERTAIPAYAWVVLSVVFLAGVAAPLNQFKVPPMIPVLMDSLEIDLTMAGLLMSVFAVTGFILAIPGGFIFQKVGARATGLIAVGCLVIGSVMGGLSTTTGLLFISRIIEGVGMGLIAIAAPAVIAAWFPAHRRGTPMGIWATWVPVGSVLIFNLAPPLETAYGWRSVWWAGAAFALVVFILYGLLLRMPAAPDSPAETGPQLGRAMANGQIWLLCLMFGCFNLAMSGFRTFLPTFLVAERGYSLVMASFVTSLTMIMTIGSCPLSGWISDRIGSIRMIMIGPFVIIAAMLLFPFHITGWLIPAYMILLGAILGAVPTAAFAAVPAVMKQPGLVGIGMAILAFGQNLGMFIGPVLFGKMVELTGWAMAGYMLIPVAGLGIAAAWRLNIH
jgi:MFS family permease